MEFADGFSVATISLTIRDDDIAEFAEVTYIRLVRIVDDGSTLPSRGAQLGLPFHFKLFPFRILSDLYTGQIFQIFFSIFFFSFSLFLCIVILTWNWKVSERIVFFCFVSGEMTQATVTVLANDSPFGVVSWNNTAITTTEPEGTDRIISLTIIREQGLERELRVSYV